VFSFFAYAHDARGRRTSASTSAGTWFYAYDALGQLVGARLDSDLATVPDQDLTFAYDALGNRSETWIDGVRADYTVNRMNQYLRAGAADYRFDADGNLVSEITPAGTTRYTYDVQNRLVSVEQGAHVWHYLYDALGNRVSTTADGATIRSVVDPFGLGNVVGEYDDGGNLLARYDYDLGLIASTHPGSNRAFYTFDGIGSTSEITDTGADLLNRYVYSPFGRLLYAAESVPNPYRFAGEYGVSHEPHGLHSMRARFYSAALGRFVSEDPVGLRGGDVNLSRYVFNDPINQMDPLGTGPYDDLPSSVSYRSWPAANGGTAWAYSEDGKVVEMGRTSPPTDPDQALLDRRGDMTRDQPDLPPLPPGSVDFSDKPGAITVPPPGAGGFGDDETGGGDGGGFGDDEGGGANPGGGGPGGAGGDVAPPVPGGGAGASGPSAGPTDPNQKRGPAGAGLVGYVEAREVLAYRIDFENDPDASAPAQFVVVTDQLASGFDWTTLELTEVGFGDHLVIVPRGLQHFETAVQLQQGTLQFETLVRVDFDLATGRLTARFMSIDPVTGLPPDVMTGFLPPEDGTGRGQGHISYVVRAKSGLSSGAEVRNVADIQFDFGETIATNQQDPHDPAQGIDPRKEARVTIDAGAPSSHVLGLPAVTTTTNFAVLWSAQDEAGGSGLAGCDVWVSDDRGPWTLWQSNAVHGSAVFTGIWNHTYAFYSVARDQVGHVEPGPPTADALTTLLPLPTLSATLLGVELRLTWPESTAPYVLESASDLTAPVSWSTVSEVPVLADGSWSIGVPATNSATFYRLRQGP
jgi:RHS repeat-associated protein